ncbi:MULTISPECIES: hypothetical protein [Enterobacteriaceae]|nr:MULTISPECIES: hypothetical protein [Enterobacteriaceae]MDF3645483.1 hypothetical protein [Enterobacter hormaechei]MEB1082369.1 hypothetical protein [Citrobacter portucalensis]UZQ97676.1 hypothetical protein OQY67_26065 [Citrobacter freundii]
MKAIYKLIEAMLVKMGFEGAAIQSVNLETGVIQCQQLTCVLLMLSQTG